MIKLINQLLKEFTSTKGVLKLIGIIFTIFIIPALGYYMNNQKVITISIATGLTLCIWVVTFFLLKSDANTSITDNHTKDIKTVNTDFTLKHYFSTDFSHLLKLSYTRALIKKDSLNNDIETVECIAQLYMDFDSLSYFLGYYIPKTKFAFSFCKKLLNDHEVIIKDLLSRVAVQQNYLSDKPTELKNLRFTGRVFIYHETFLFESEIEELTNLIKNTGMSIQLRGIDYLLARDTLERKNL